MEALFEANERQRLSATRGGVLSPSGSWVVFVTGVHMEAEDEDLFEAFSEFGDVRAIHLNPDKRTGFCKGYCLVEYAERTQAEEAIAEMDGKDVLGNKIEVSWAYKKKGGKRQ